MTHSLTDHPSQAELIAELYDRYAAGLFAYCADQLGDHGSAADALVSVLSSVPATPPPRAALFAFARREIHRRDVVYAPSVVDPLIDPASALVERALRELRPHQREVLVLGEVCGLDLAELAWVLDVAPDTADELATSAALRYRQALDTALAYVGPRIPKPVADVYGALGVAPLRDVLGRLPWPSPPEHLHSRFVSQVMRGRTAAPMFVKPLWPGPPTWPLPLGEADPATTTGIFPTELLTPPSPSRVPEHEAPTAPMPKLRFGPDEAFSGTGQPFSGLDQAFSGIGRRLEGPGRVPSGPDQAAPGADPAPAGQRFFTPRPTSARSAWEALFGARPPKDAPSTAKPFPDPLFGAWPPEDGSSGAKPVHDGLFRLPQPVEPGSGKPVGEAVTKPPFPLSASIPGDVLDDDAVTQELPAIGDILVHKGPAREPGALFVPRSAAKEPVYRMPVPLMFPPSVDDLPIVDDLPDDLPDMPAVPEARVRPGRDKHYDWAWELVGFLVCVVIAMIVFFAVPLVIGP
ncbi:RNA polymerase sigma factor [Nonomuraea guangzhouensis]|uniref:DNA-directed RNA polymerase specialized sigma24 family protein n=1 Tax=Nonomuraea guangzhouensis TaxID=1291555 RepID=A0ABW4G0M6_9ACTN|nr:hypothetical protein [Nonomuraea guangzhouensis]